MIIGTNIIETRVEVTLADIGPLERPYASTRIIPTAMTVIYRTGDRVDRGAPWLLYAIELHGTQAKKDGSPSRTTGSMSRYSRSWSNEFAMLPVELVEYAEAHLPTTYPADWLHATEESR